MKQLDYDSFNKVTSLNEVWVSKANAQQRRGRAGRTKPG